MVSRAAPLPTKLAVKEADFGRHHGELDPGPANDSSVIQQPHDMSGRSRY